jgi:hypothetical protein
MGRSDAEYASEPEERHSVSGGTVFLCGAVIFAFFRMQKCVTLSVTEAEYVAAMEVVQNMLFTWRVLQSMGLTVEFPMDIQVDIKGAVDLDSQQQNPTYRNKSELPTRIEGGAYSFDQLGLQQGHVFGYLYQKCWRQRF